MTVSICVATHCRPERLRDLMQDLARQVRRPDQVVIVDNDAEASARPVVEDLRAAGTPFAIAYEVQPERNIALTRNRTVALATGDWLAFIDDDERAPEQWLERLIGAANAYQAQGVLGPVEPRLPADASKWIQRGRFYDFPRFPTGTPVPLNRMRFGNALLCGVNLRREPGPFDTSYELTTGEDGDLLVRLVEHGAKIVWCDDAVVYEPIERKRLSLVWLLLRSASGGQEFARQFWRGRYGPITHLDRAIFVFKCLSQLLFALALTLVSWPAGRHRAAAWLVVAAANSGKLAALWGWRYRAYA